MDNVVMVVVLGVSALGALWLLYYALFSKKRVRPKREDEPELQPIPEKQKKGEMNMVGIQKWLQIAVMLAVVAVLFWGVMTLNGISGQLSAVNQQLTELSDINQQLTDMTGSGTDIGLLNPFRTRSGSLSGIQSQLSGIESQLRGIEHELWKINLYGIDIK